MIISILLILIFNYAYSIIAMVLNGDGYSSILQLFSITNDSTHNNSNNSLHVIISSSTYTLWCSISLIALTLYTTSQSTLLGLERALISMRFNHREDILSVFCLASSILSFILSFIILGAVKPGEDSVFSIHTAKQHLINGLRTICLDNKWDQCVQLLDADDKRSTGILWGFLRLLCALLSSVVVFSIFMPIVRIIRCHIHIDSKLMQQYYFSETEQGHKKSRRTMIYSWLNIILPLFIVLCYFDPFMTNIMGIHDNSKKLAIVFLLTMTSSLVGFYSVRSYVQSYLFYTVHHAVEDATKETKSKKSSTNKILIETDLLKEKMLIYMKYVVLVAIQVLTLPILQFSLAVLFHTRGAFSIIELFFPSLSTKDPPIKTSGDELGQFFIHIGGFLCFCIHACTFIIGLLSMYWYGTRKSGGRIRAG
jgi:hypothetical protein